METKLQQEITKVLSFFPDYWNEATLLKNKLIEDIRSYDKRIIEALLSSELIRDTYSLQLSSGTIFKVEEFISMLRFKNYWDNSYTKYTNEIGLSSENKYIKYSTDVVLDFPHKDGVLEGGMDKDSQGKNEIYYHTILAKEEIDTLFSPKVLTNIKKYNYDGETSSTPQSFSDYDNLIIKGNNLIALHSIKKRYAGKVKMIYIDPPFNTEHDSFLYNDKFSHSTWLTFMKNRLEVARELLSEDGTIYVHLDHNEVHYLKVLMDEIFGRKNFLNELIWAYRERETSKRFYNRKHDTILFYAKNASSNYTFNYDEIRENYSAVTVSKFKYTDEEGRKYRLRTKDGRSDPAEEDENTYRQYLDEKSGPLPRDWFVMPFLNQSSEERVGFNTQKPETLLAKFIKASTNEGDIVMDFFSGSATTVSVAHKLKRRYVGVEQLDYMNTLTLPRMERVVQGEQSGISKKIGWQGGGSFVYVELVSLNETFIEKIISAQTKEKLNDVLHEIKDEAYLNFEVELEKIIEKNSDFYYLSLEDQKNILLHTLDMNQTYLNYSEIEDSQYDISDSVKAFNHSFYQKEGDTDE